MISLPISKPLFALLLCSFVLTVIVLLKPVEGEEEQDLVGVNMSTSQSKPTKISTSSAIPEGEELAPWIRQPQPAPVVVMKRAEPQGIVKVQLSKPVVTEPPKAIAPAPQFQYLGQMVRDGERSIFLDGRSGLQVVKLGDTLDGVWQIDKITESVVDMNYIPLNQTRQITIQ